MTTSKNVKSSKFTKFHHHVCLHVMKKKYKKGHKKKVTSGYTLQKNSKKIKLKSFHVNVVVVVVVVVA